MPPILTFSALRFSWNHSHYETTRRTVSGYQVGVVGDNLQISLERRIKTLRSVKLCLCSDLPCIPNHKSIYSFLWNYISPKPAYIHRIFTLGVHRSYNLLVLHTSAYSIRSLLENGKRKFLRYAERRTERDWILNFQLIYYENGRNKMSAKSVHAFIKNWENFL